jgi:YesN/AraC family two-component response regulator
MPEMNGRELAKRVYALCPAIKCIFMSGYLDEFIAEHDREGTTLNFILKPFSKVSLAAKVREVLNNREGKRLG